MLRYGYGHQDSKRPQRDCRARQGYGPTIDTPRNAPHFSRKLTPAAAQGFIPLTEREAALVRMLALGHSFDAIVERFGCDPAEVLQSLRDVAGRAARR